MEIEAKFQFTDPTQIATLATCTNLGAYQLHAHPPPQQQRNVYYDTSDGRVRSARYGLRIRYVDGRQLLTLKGPTTLQDGVHQRAEWEFEAPTIDPATWPDGEARYQAMQLIGAAPLVPQLTIATIRRIIMVEREGVPIAEMALDQAWISAGGRGRSFEELEVELRPPATRSDLDAFVAVLCETFPLLPETQTKLTRGMLLLEERRSSLKEPSVQAINQLLERYAVDRAHARQVADGALVLFDAFQERYALPARGRHLLEIGALLHNIGLNQDPAQHHIVGRDLILNTQIAPLSSDQRAMVAALVVFHRKRVRPLLEPSYVRLSRRDRKVVRQLAAILRVADGLDYTGTQGTALSGVVYGEGTIELLLGGPHAEADGTQAIAKADLWKRVFADQLTVSIPAIFSPVEDTTTLAPVAVAPPHHAGLFALPVAVAGAFQGQMGMTEALQVLLRRHFRRMLMAARDLQRDETPEHVHGLRVASRRVRSILAFAAEVAPEGHVRRFRRGIAQIAQAASSLRDGDVFLTQINRYRDQLPEAQRMGIEPLANALEADRMKARSSLLALLDSGRYTQFCRTFATFMTDAARWEPTLRMRDRVGSRIWRTYEALRAFETVDLQAAAIVGSDHERRLHLARIAGKQLRYSLEIVSEALVLDITELLNPLIALQESLGQLQDSAVAINYVATVAPHVADRQVLEAYLATREAERVALYANLGPRWAHVMSASFGQQLMELVVKL